VPSSAPLARKLTYQPQLLSAAGTAPTASAPTSAPALTTPGQAASYALTLGSSAAVPATAATTTVGTGPSP
jgi:hypothetical protein